MKNESKVESVACWNWNYFRYIWGLEVQTIDLRYIISSLQMQQIEQFTCVSLKNYGWISWQTLDFTQRDLNHCSKIKYLIQNWRYWSYGKAIRSISMTQIHIISDVDFLICFLFALIPNFDTFQKSLWSQNSQTVRKTIPFRNTYDGQSQDQPRCTLHG
jgi:hypothetical protein